MIIGKGVFEGSFFLSETAFFLSGPDSLLWLFFSCDSRDPEPFEWYNNYEGLKKQAVSFSHSASCHSFIRDSALSNSSSQRIKQNTSSWLRQFSCVWFHIWLTSFLFCDLSSFSVLYHQFDLVFCFFLFFFFLLLLFLPSLLLLSSLQPLFSFSAFLVQVWLRTCILLATSMWPISISPKWWLMIWEKRHKDKGELSCKEGQHEEGMVHSLFSFFTFQGWKK